MHNYVLHNINPASEWLESYPVGNGRLGCTVMGTVAQEVLYLNEETIFSSRKNIEHTPEIYEKVQKLRSLLLEGKDIEADKFAKTIMKNEYRRIHAYGVAGIMKISLHNCDACENYYRDLDMINGKVITEYDVNGSHFTRECFSSYPDDVLVYRIICDNAKIDASINYEYEKCLSRHGDANEFYAVSETLFGEHKFAVGFKVETDGKTTYENGRMAVCGASSIVIYCNIKTEFKAGKDFEKSIDFPSASYDELLSRHTEDFSALMNRADIELPKIEEVENVSMKARMTALLTNVLPDWGLYAMHWQYGRYLLVSSSRPSSLPANLQGLWVNDMASPWNADYHTNVNLQMNYWASEAVNLSDCHVPLFDYMNNYLLSAGKKCADYVYHSRGCVIHHLSDIYGFSGMADGVWGIWPMGAAWLAHHMWEHYLYTKDVDFLRNTAYEYIRQCAIFFIDNTVKTDDGYYATVPSTVPEHQYVTKDENGNNYRGWVSINTTMDIETISMLMTIYEEASKILGIDDEDVRFAPKLKAGLPPLQIGKFGQLREWIKDYDESDVGHNHIAHAYALFPFGTITSDMKELRDAVKVSIDRRTQKPTFGMGWNTVLPAIMYARLGLGNNSLPFLNRVITTCSSLSLLDTFALKNYPRGFQIDGNFGFTSAITEMLFQSHEGKVQIIPAIPDAWDHGSFRGLCARGGYTVDAKWCDYEVKEFAIEAKFAGDCIIELPKTQKANSFADANGNIYTAKDNKIIIPMKKDEKINLIAK